MNTSSSLFRFATIRNPTRDVNPQPKPAIQPKTEVTDTLVNILESDQKKSEKIKAFNKALNDFIKSKNFYKTTAEVKEVIDTFLNPDQGKRKTGNVSITEIENLYKNLYNNIVVRTITKSNTTEVFKLLTDAIKRIYQKLNTATVALKDIEQVQIILPAGLIFSFSSLQQDDEPVLGNIPKQNPALLSKINGLIKQKEQIAGSKKENAKQLQIEQEKISKQQNDVARVQSRIQETAAKQTKKVSQSKMEAALKGISTAALDKLTAIEATLNETEKKIDTQLTTLNTQAFQLLPEVRYARVSEKYIDITRFLPKPPVIKDDAIFVYSKGCYLKFPFQVADLKVVEQKTVGYLPNEIAHINNTQSGEKQEKVTRRLKRVETYESLITEDEVTQEKDTQSLQKFTLEKAASDVQSEETSVNVNASASGTYGVVTASLDAGFSHTESAQNANSSSQSYAQEVVQKIVDKVSHKVKSERSVKSIEEFEETVTHLIDNSGVNNTGPKSYVYRWLTRLVKATLKNYGKRLIFKIEVPHPSNYYLSRAIKDNSLKIPPDPRLLKETSTDPAIRSFYQLNPTFPYFFEVNKITKDTYLAWGDLYHTKLEQPPLDKVLVCDVEVKDKNLTIPEGYYAHKVHVNKCVFEDSAGWANLVVLVGRTQQSVWIDPNTLGVSVSLDTKTLDGEITQLPIAFASTANNGRNLTIEVECLLTERAFTAWQIKCYHAIIEAYENLKAEAEGKMSAFNPNNPGLNPSRKNELIRAELKKGALRKMFRCNPFWISDDYIVGQEYVPDCCEDSLNAEKISFLETTFDWKNMTYELHPYYYANKENWQGLFNLSDDDPQFEAFLQASYATVRIPVVRDSQKEVAAVNFILNNSIANYAVVPDSMAHLLEDLKVNTPFGYITDAPFVEIIKEYDKYRNLKIYYLDDLDNEVICTEVIESDKEGNKTKFYYNSATNQLVISEIKEGINDEGQKYNYYFDSSNKKIICHKKKTAFDIDGIATPYYSTDLGIFPIPTDLVILEAGTEKGIKVRGYPEDTSDPTSDVLIPRQYSPAIISDEDAV